MQVGLGAADLTGPWVRVSAAFRRALREAVTRPSTHATVSGRT